MITNKRLDQIKNGTDCAAYVNTLEAHLSDRGGDVDYEGQRISKRIQRALALIDAHPEWAEDYWDFFGLKERYLAELKNPGGMLAFQFGIHQ